MNYDKLIIDRFLSETAAYLSSSYSNDGDLNIDIEHKFYKSTITLFYSKHIDIKQYVKVHTINYGPFQPREDYIIQDTENLLIFWGGDLRKAFRFAYGGDIPSEILKPLSNMEERFGTTCRGCTFYHQEDMVCRFSQKQHGIKNCGFEDNRYNFKMTIKSMFRTTEKYPSQKGMMNTLGVDYKIIYENSTGAVLCFGDFSISINSEGHDPFDGPEVDLHEWWMEKMRHVK